MNVSLADRNIALEVDAAIRAKGIAIHGVSIGRKFDKATWRVDFVNDPSPEDQKTVADVISGIEI